MQKWNNTFNHMKQSAQGFFSLSFLFHSIIVSHFVFLSLHAFLSPSMLAPANDHRHKQGISLKSCLHLCTQTHHSVDDIF